MRWRSSVPANTRSTLAASAVGLSARTPAQSAGRVATGGGAEPVGWCVSTDSQDVAGDTACSAIVGGGFTLQSVSAVAHTERTLTHTALPAPNQVPVPDADIPRQEYQQYYDLYEDAFCVVRSLGHQSCHGLLHHGLLQLWDVRPDALPSAPIAVLRQPAGRQRAASLRPLRPGLSHLLHRSQRRPGGRLDLSAMLPEQRGRSGRRCPSPRGRAGCAVLRRSGGAARAGCCGLDGRCRAEAPEAVGPKEGCGEDGAGRRWGPAATSAEKRADDGGNAGEGRRGRRLQPEHGGVTAAGASRRCTSAVVGRHAAASDGGSRRWRRTAVINASFSTH